MAPGALLNMLQNMQQPGMGAEIGSSAAGITTLQDLLNVGAASWSRSDPTLWNIRGRQVRINPELYKQITEYYRMPVSMRSLNPMGVGGQPSPSAFSPQTYGLRRSPLEDALRRLQGGM